MYKTFIKKNNLSATMILFLILYLFFVYLKPNFIFNKSGGIRNFGLGKVNSTVLPIWLVVILLAIMSYMSVLYYLM